MTRVTGSRKPGFRITYIHAFTAIGSDDEEGVIAFMSADGPMPMIAADPERLEQLRPIAQQVADAMDVTVTLARFGTREDLETL